jgi:hypothetical protein
MSQCTPSTTITKISNEIIFFKKLYFFKMATDNSYKVSQGKYKAKPKKASI